MILQSLVSTRKKQKTETKATQCLVYSLKMFLHKGFHHVSFSARLCRKLHNKSQSSCESVVQDSSFHFTSLNMKIYGTEKCVCPNQLRRNLSAVFHAAYLNLKWHLFFKFIWSKIVGCLWEASEEQAGGKWRWRSTPGPCCACIYPT